MGVRHEAKTLAITAVPVARGNPFLPRCCRTSACSGAPAVKFSGFGRCRRGRPLMLGVRLQGRREMTVESGRSECALHEIGLRASEVRHSLAPWMQRRTRTVPAEIREGAIGGHTVVSSVPHNRPSMHHQIENTWLSRLGLGSRAGGPCSLARGTVVVTAVWVGLGCDEPSRCSRTWRRSVRVGKSRGEGGRLKQWWAWVTEGNPLQSRPLLRVRESAPTTLQPN